MSLNSGARMAAHDVTWIRGMSYGLLALPLAFVAMPLYIALPRHYAENFAVPLGWLGLCLLVARLGDAVCDPWIGRWVDRVLMHSRRRVLTGSALAGVVLVGALYALFFPWQTSGSGFWWSFGVCLSVTYLAYSMLSITHQAWAARWGASDEVQARWVSWREAMALAGVVLASTVPAWAGWKLAIVLCAAGLMWGVWGLSRSPWVRDTASAGDGPSQTPTASAGAFDATPPTSPWRVAAFRQLMMVFVLNGMASAIPATLVLFFIRDRVQAQAWEPLFLGGYFLAAALSMPVWVACVSRQGLMACWRLGMLLSVAAFAWTLGMGAGDRGPFLVICLASGAALGADLVVPAAALARVIRSSGPTPGGHADRAGHYFGWWNFANKLNLALAAGVALPILQVWGYVPADMQGTSGLALSLAYGLLPCILKLMAWALLFYFQRRELGSVLIHERGVS